MTEKDMLERIELAAKVYNQNRLHRDFQAEEIDKFISWMYQQYGIVRNKGIDQK